MKKYNRIKLVLKQQKRTGKWLAQKLGKDPVTISRWNRNIQQPHLETLFEIADLLRVPVCVLLEESEVRVDRKKE
ncbi:MAG: helix-turn-helix transcriptional regulator [Lewinella sp.]|nr:helix-turn-helix transcriptional regulator [Lewinella sp.]